IVGAVNARDKKQKTKLHIQGGAMSYLNEDQELMLDAVREFAQTELRPRVLTELERDIFPYDLLDRMKELGLPLMAMPEEYGGLGESMVAHVAIEKEVAKENMTMALIGTNCVVASLIVRMGTQEQKDRYLPDLLETPGGFAFTEPAAGSDASGIEATAVKDGDEWVINGQKTFISFINQANYFLISARTNETGDGGISAFLVPKDTPGLKLGSIFHKLGLRGSDTGELFFEDVRVPAIAMIGKENKGLHAALSLLDEARLGVASCAVGLAEAALEKSVEYVKGRVAFGRPLATKQGLQWYAAEMETKISAARALLFEVANDYDEGRSITVGAAKAKLFATSVAVEVTDRAIQMCGGYGLIEDYGVERLYRDARTCAIIEGTDEILKIVVSRQVLS
ncbi:acyl-CoA dehydrogenase family protein, partial [Gordonibacter sp.]|uniref:acyl-CoA dehydrogenase family protein n=2 Tax=Gordonibacter sp. TaxID=1968902 RepID=UPI002FC7D520